jgi:hypothetical protein
MKNAVGGCGKLHEIARKVALRSRKLPVFDFGNSRQFRAGCVVLDRR